MCFLCVRQLVYVQLRHTATVGRGHVICVYYWPMSATQLYKRAEFLSWQREIVAVETREQSELEPEVHKSTGGSPVRI
jgi:hypothetical protein